MRSNQMGWVARAASALALAAVAVTGVAMPASAAAPQYDRDRYDRDHDHDYDRDRDRQYRRQSLGRNRYRYTYNGRDYDYTIDNRRGDLEPREVAERAQQSGYQQGRQDGEYDAGTRNFRPNPQGHGAYQFALDGWDPNWGSGVVYQRAYRQAYLRGYNESVSYNRRGGRQY